MKIDPNILSNVDLQSDPLKNAKGGAIQSTAGATPEASTKASSEDTFQLSSKHGDVQNLTAQLAQVPEVRTQLVTPLKARVAKGSYKPDSGKVADAMLADQRRLNTKA